MTRWVVDGLRLVSLAQAACDSRGWSAADRLAIVRQDNVATFLFKKSPFTAAEAADIRAVAAQLGFDVLYAPFSDPAGGPTTDNIDDEPARDYGRLIRAVDPDTFYTAYPHDIRPTTDDRPFFFHTTKLQDQLGVAFGRSMLFGNGLSALLTLLGLSAALVVLFVIGPLALTERGVARPRHWFAWLVYFGALGAGFMLVEVSVLQRFVLLLGHPVYSLTVTLFSLLLGTGIGAAWSRRFAFDGLRTTGAIGLAVVAAVALALIVVGPPVVSWAIPFSRGVRMVVAMALLLPMGIAMGIPMPTGLRLLSARAPQLVAWAWGMNGALSVLGATLAIFVAMNWGFHVTLLVASATYILALASLLVASQQA
jgi:hypothetical protein